MSMLLIYIDGLVVGSGFVFTILWTYTSSKSGLSAQKSESNLGDATISLRMVNEDTSCTCVSLLCKLTHQMFQSNNQPSIKGGETFYTIGDGAVCLAHSGGTKSLYDKIAVAQTAQDISSANIAGLPNSRNQYASLIAGGFEKDNVNQTCSQEEKCVVVLYLSYFIMSSLNLLRSIAIRRFQ